MSAGVLHEIVDRLPYDGNPDAKPSLHARISAEAGEQLDDDWAERYGVSEAQLADLQARHEPEPEPEPAKPSSSEAAKKTTGGKP